jgi:2C-methyl-D-erythritol 2,4-cyclodiphosphate synthase
VKRVEGTAITETLPRESICRRGASGVPANVLRDAVAGTSGVSATDEAALAERAGYTVHVIEGDVANVKITTSADLDAARLTAGAGPLGPRTSGLVGIGYDLHRLVEGRPLVLGGVTIPAERGALGHSDADVVCHAYRRRARRGARGRHRPVVPGHGSGMEGRPTPAAARRSGNPPARRHRQQRDRRVLILERPKLAPYRERIERQLAGALGVEPERVSVKAKTNEGVGAIGRGEAIAAHAVALLVAIRAPGHPGSLAP